MQIAEETPARRGTLSICEPLDASTHHNLSSAWLRDVIEGEQAPHLVHSRRSVREAWRDAHLGNLLEKLDGQTQICLFITPTGVLGYYNTALVQTFVRAGRPYGRVTDPTVMPQGEVELPHIQIAAGITLNMFVNILHGKPANDFVFNAKERTYVRTVGNVLPQVTPFMAPEVPQDAAICANVSFYVSQAGTVTNLHWDMYSGVIHQLKGRKRVILFPGDEKVHFSMYPNRHIFARRSTVAEKLTEATLATYPDMRRARGYECIIEPDQFLYIPAGWLHHVETLDDDTISLITRFTR